jgi:hypothetical protein
MSSHYNLPDLITPTISDVVSFEAFIVMTFQIKNFWVVMSCSVVVGSVDLSNVGILPHYVASQPRSPQLEI